MNRYIIMGAGIAGLTAASAIRQIDMEGSIDIFTRENNLPYSRPMLTKTPFKSFNEGDWTIYSHKWFQQNKINLHLGESIEKIDADGHKFFSAGKEYCYDKLIVATGAESFVPPIPGSDRENIFTIRRSEDIMRIKRAFKQNTDAVIIGGGVIGLEAAVELYRYGANVTVLEAMPYLMMRQIDKEISDLICRKLSDVNIHTNVKIAEIEENQVRLADGRAFHYDLIVMACGVKAETSAMPCQMNIPRAIEIDDHCRTSVDDIYAAGDCAQHSGVNYALWSQAMAQGEVAGKHAAGIKDAVLTSFDTSLVMNSPELSLFALGDLGKNPELDYETVYKSSNDDALTFFANPSQGEFFEKQYLVDGKLVGAAIVGNLTRMHELKALINGKEAL